MFWALNKTRIATSSPLILDCSLLQSKFTSIMLNHGKVTYKVVARIFQASTYLVRIRSSKRLNKDNEVKESSNDIKKKNFNVISLNQRIIISQGTKLNKVLATTRDPINNPKRINVVKSNRTQQR